MLSRMSAKLYLSDDSLGCFDSLHFLSTVLQAKYFGQRQWVAVAAQHSLAGSYIGHGQAEVAA